MSDQVAEDEPAVLGNKSLLDKIDRLRELGVGNIVPLPQLVVVGDQSSGKSSVLEGLTGFSFPRAAGLCTRYATQITCRRAPQRYVDMSIIPRSTATEKEKERLRAFHRVVTDLQPTEFAKVFEEANRTMGILPLDGGDALNDNLSTFSEDILKIEISGPEQTHLTVIDVPGIFRNATPGLTTENDIELIRRMVKNYIKDARTIILAVVPCNVDIVTQEILELAKAADPTGARTMGVLTKPDLVIERANQQVVLDLLLGKRNDLRLGYCVVKNRDADDMDSTIRQRHEREKNFFRNDPWSTIAGSDRTGINSLKRRLSELLMDISKKEFPQVKSEVTKNLTRCREELAHYGEARGDSHAQRLYLGKLSSQFQKLTTCALDANYTHDKIFEDHNGKCKLVTRIIDLNEVFAYLFHCRGHTRKFKSIGGQGDNEDELPAFARDKVEFDLPFSDELPELSRIVVPDRYKCAAPSGDSLLDHIQSVYNSSRGPELGTFGGSILATTFKEQAKKWEDLVLSHVSDAIMIVHDFIYTMLAHVIPDERVRGELWENVLLERLCAAYTQAMNHARFLLEIELRGTPTTYNHYFNANLAKCRMDRLETQFNDVAGCGSEDDSVVSPIDPFDQKRKSWTATAKINAIPAITLTQLRNMKFGKSNAEQIRDDIHDILYSYYKVSRKRFVDVVCQQVIDHFLLNGKESPLKIFSPDLVMGLTDAQLESIAGEEAGTKRKRELLSQEIKSFEAAMKVLRG